MNSIISGRAQATLGRTALSLAFALLGFPAAAQIVYRFHESGAARPMVLAPQQIAVKANSGASAADVRDALRRHAQQSDILEQWGRLYLAQIPPLQDSLRLTARSASLRQEAAIAETAPVLYVLQAPPGTKGGMAPQIDERLRRLASMRIVTKQVVADLAKGNADESQIREATGALSAEPVGSSGWWLFSYATPREALDAAHWMTETAKLDATPDFQRSQSKRMSPNDPLFPSQWHLTSALYGINVMTAWDTRQGTGRHIAVVDDGLELAHPDLMENTYSVASGNHLDLNDGDNDPNPVLAADDHGTAVAGLAAARGNNGLGVVGVAFKSKLLGVRLTSAPSSDADKRSAFTWKPLLTDVSSNAWGAPDDAQTLWGPGVLANEGLLSAVTNGRGGRGVVFVFPAGNGGAVGDDSNYDGFANSRYVITVGGTIEGTPWAGSDGGANVALSAPARNLTTTDLAGNAGSNLDDYQGSFTGTSGSVPLVAGAAALLLEANPNLGYRDVKEILIRSASRTRVDPVQPFVANGAGIHFSHTVGAGLLDVGNALALASTWTNLPAESSISSTQSALNLSIPDNNPAGVTRFFDMGGMANLRVETVELTVNLTHPYRGDLEFVITAPSGMQSRIAKRGLDANADYSNWTFTSVRHWGESSSGTWTVRVADLSQVDAGQLNSLTLRIWGTSTAPDLTISKTHSGNFTQGQTGAYYSLTVTNAGPTATAGPVAVADTLPAGLTAVSISGAGWTCTAPAGPCSRSDTLSPGASYPAITLTVNVAGNAPGTLTNHAAVSGGGETNTANNVASDQTTILPAPPPAPVLVSPANGATGASISSTLSWNAASGATSYDVYFGTAANPPFLINKTSTSHAPGTLAAGTKYYWKIVSLNTNGNTASATWSFTTASASPPPSGLRFIAVTPCRVVDTRNASGAFGGPFMSAGSTRSFALPQGSCGIPFTAQAYSLNVTVVPHGPLSYLTMWPAGESQPYVSTLNSFAGDIVANAAIVPAGTGGAVSVFVTNNTELILDINGYFTPDTGAAFYAATPCRVADTRNPAGPFGGPVMGGGASRSFTVPSGTCSIPPTATAYAMNATVVPPAPLAYLTTWPAGQAMPVVSTLNSYQGRVVANAAIIPAGTGGAINAFVTDQTHLIFDINGYFGPTGGAAALSFQKVTPCRVVDTRGANGTFGGPILAGGGARSFPVPQSSCGIPTTAKAYSVNVTVVPTGALDYLTAWPTGNVMPVVSTLNSYHGAVVANAAIIPAGTNGSLSFFATQNTHLIVDINGFFQ